MMDADVAPVFQTYVPPPDAVSVTELPLHTVVAELMDAAGGGFTFTVAMAEAVHPFPFVIVTV